MLFNFLKTKFKFSKNLSDKQFLFVYLSIVFILFTAISFFVLKVLSSISIIKNFIANLDFLMIKFIENWRSDIFAKAITFITYFGDWKLIGGITLILLTIFAIKKYWQKFILLLGTIFGSEIFVYLIKHLIKRDRPLFTSIIFEDGFSFPSGHSLIAVSFYGILAFFLTKKFRKKWQKIIIWMSAIIFIFLISFSRIYLGVHWLSDTIGGIIGGLIWLIIMIKFIKIQF